MCNIKTKVCAKCNKEKDVTGFYPKKRYKFGVNSVCKECICSYLSNRYSNGKCFNISRLPENNKISCKVRREALPNWYVIQILKTRKKDFNIEIIPDKLIELKKNTLLLKKTIKENDKANTNV